MPDIEAASRKYRRAMDGFGDRFLHVQTYREFKPTKDSVEFTTYFRILTPQGAPSEKYRFDYEMRLDKPLPRVGEIRALLWWSLRSWQKSHGAIGNASSVIGSIPLTDNGTVT